MDKKGGKIKNKINQGVDLSCAGMELLLRGASLCPRWVLELGWGSGHGNALKK